MKRRVFLFFLFLVIILSISVFREPLIAHTKTVLILCEQLPFIPIKLLSAITKEPTHETVTFSSKYGTVYGDVFTPRSSFFSQDDTYKALILATGVWVKGEDKKKILQFAEQLSRLGYVVLWPRLEEVEKGKKPHEEPETFVQAFEYLKKKKSVDSLRISYIGFSVGSSFALIGAQDKRIAHTLRSVVFFGGYYDVFSYIVSLATGTMIVDTKAISWQREDWVVGHIKKILKEENAQSVLTVFAASSYTEAQRLLASIPQEEKKRLQRINPKQGINRVKTTVFILHDQKDPFVPYVESVELSHALQKHTQTVLVITNIFEHVQLRKSVSPSTVGEFLKLYSFVYTAFSYF